MTLHYKQYGNPDHPLFVFLHGGGVSGYMWEEQIKYFSSSYHCLVPDLPTHGKSRSIELFSMSHTAGLVHELIAKYANGKKVIVTGFSLGAQVLVELLSQQPKLIDYAIINSALVKPMPSSKLWLKPMLALSLPLTRSKFFAKAQANVLYIPDHQFEQYYEESRLTKLSELNSVMVENMSFDIPPSYKQADAKILVTVGMQEKKMMKQSAKALVDQNQQSTGIIFPNIGHGASIADPKRFNHTIELFLNDQALPQELIAIT